LSKIDIQRHDIFKIPPVITLELHGQDMEGFVAAYGRKRRARGQNKHLSALFCHGQQRYLGIAITGTRKTPRAAQGRPLAAAA
jgi:hypothetical protein